MKKFFSIIFLCVTAVFIESCEDGRDVYNADMPIIGKWVLSSSIETDSITDELIQGLKDKQSVSGSLKINQDGSMQYLGRILFKKDRSYSLLTISTEGVWRKTNDALYDSILQIKVLEEVTNDPSFCKTKTSEILDGFKKLEFQIQTVNKSILKVKNIESFARANSMETYSRSDYREPGEGPEDSRSDRTLKNSTDESVGESAGESIGAFFLIAIVTMLIGTGVLVGLILFVIWLIRRWRTRAK